MTCRSCKKEITIEEIQNVCSNCKKPPFWDYTNVTKCPSCKQELSSKKILLGFCNKCGYKMYRAMLSDYFDMPKGGIKIPMSRCCNAPTYMATGGIIQEICSKCGNHNPPEPHFVYSGRLGK